MEEDNNGFDKKRDGDHGRPLGGRRCIIPQ